MLGHGGIVAFDDRTDMRDVARHLLRFGAARELRQVLPVPHRAAARATRCSTPTRPVDRAQLEQLLEALEVGSLCAHGGGMPAPIRSLLAHFPDELGLALMNVTVDGRAIEVADGATILDAARAAERAACRRCASTSARRRSAPAASAWSASRARANPLPACTTPVPRRDGDRHRTTRPRGASPRASSSSSSPSCPSRPRRTPSWPQVAARLDVGDAALDAAPRTSTSRDERHPYLAFRHELCISCGRCVRACDEVQGAFALTATGRGFDANVAAGLDAGFRDSTCVSCGACADTCPTDAITEMTLLDLAAQQ